MKREVILLSDLDLKIIKFLTKERYVKDIFKEFYIDYSMIKKHLDRLRRLKCIRVVHFGTFRKVSLNKQGEDILHLFKNVIPE